MASKKSAPYFLTYNQQLDEYNPLHIKSPCINDQMKCSSPNSAAEDLVRKSCSQQLPGWNVQPDDTNSSMGSEVESVCSQIDRICDAHANWVEKVLSDYYNRSLSYSK